MVNRKQPTPDKPKSPPAPPVKKIPVEEIFDRLIDRLENSSNCRCVAAHQLREIALQAKYE